MPKLPERPSLEHLKKQAKRLHRAATASDAEAMALVGPYFGDPAAITLQQAQLVIARDYGFSSWRTLKQHVDAGGGGTETTEQRSNRFLDLVCLHYGPDATRGAHNFVEAATLLQEYPEIARHSAHTAAATGDVMALNTFIQDDPAVVHTKSGPFQWTPLMYAAYARLPGRSSLATGQVLLSAGADPNAHYMWGGTYRFAVLTGIFGDGEGGKTRLPEHPDMVAFARAALDAGANPNDSQGAYNRCFSADNTHLELMLEYGLKDSDPSDWMQVEGDRAPVLHRTMHFQLIIAMRWGFAERARLLIENGVDLNQPDNNYYPTYTVGYAPYQVALMRGMPEIAALIKRKGGHSEPLSGAEQFQAACMIGDLPAAQALASKHMGADPEKDAELLREAAGNGNVAAVETMIALGFPLSPPGTSTALHAAAWRGHTEVIKTLLKGGADSTLREPEHFSSPLGHALYGQQQGAIELLSQASMDIYIAAAMGNIDQIRFRLEEDESWINAPFIRVSPQSDRDWPNHWAPPLWYAAVNGQGAAVTFLLEQGADPAIRAPDDRSIADCARDAGHSGIADQILSASG